MCKRGALVEMSTGKGLNWATYSAPDVRVRRTRDWGQGNPEGGARRMREYAFVMMAILFWGMVRRSDWFREEKMEKPGERRDERDGADTNEAATMRA